MSSHVPNNEVMYKPHVLLPCCGNNVLLHCSVSYVLLNHYQKLIN